MAMAAGLKPDPSGVWTASSAESISYPPEGNNFCFDVEERSFWFQHRNDAIVTVARRFPPGNGPVFDVGAGNGFVAAGLSAAGFDTVVIEPNAVGARNALKRGLKHVVQSTLASAGFHDHTAGAVGLFDVLEHIESELPFLAEIQRCLIPGGRLYISVPAYQSLWSVEDVLAGHYRRYNRRRLRALLSSAGFEIEYITYIFWWLPLPVFTCRALPSRVGIESRCASSVGEHTLGGRAIRCLTVGSFSIELAAIRRGLSLPFGGSCLAVGRAR
jgi:SAM-dependent methyltransferase